MRALFFVLALGNASLQIPLSGDPLSPAAVDGLRSVTGVGRIDATATTLALEVAPESEVRLRDLAREIERYSQKKTTIDADRWLVVPHHSRESVDLLKAEG